MILIMKKLFLPQISAPITVHFHKLWSTFPVWPMVDIFRRRIFLKYLGIQILIVSDIQVYTIWILAQIQTSLTLLLRTFSPSLFFQRLSTARFTYAQVQYIIAQPKSALHSAQKYSMVVSIGCLINECIRLVHWIDI